VVGVSAGFVICVKLFLELGIALVHIWNLIVVCLSG
jgi:hypothetical protein